jgi:hypothetical protein
LTVSCIDIVLPSVTNADMEHYNIMISE